MEENHAGLLEQMEDESPPSGGEASVIDPCMTMVDGVNSGSNFLNELKQDPEIAKQLERFPKYNGVLVYYYLYKGMRTQEKDNSLIAEAAEKASVTYQHAYYFIGNFRRATGESRTRTRRDAGPWEPPHFPCPGPLQQHLTQYGQSGSPSLESASADGHDADGSSELAEGSLGTSTGYRDGFEERAEGDGLVGPPSDGAMWGACSSSPFRGCGQEMELVTDSDRILEKLKANKDIARRLERFPKYNRVLAYYYLYKGMRTQEKDNPLIAEAAEKASVTYQHAYVRPGVLFRRVTPFCVCVHLWG
uniref:uncharacterized protein n=1 Tax=Myxine glutinosa TaxID=7769 RepID=UPI00358FBCB6